jgi:hypothetical protein
MDPHPGDTFLITGLMADHLLDVVPDSLAESDTISHAERYAMKVLRFASTDNIAKVWCIPPGEVDNAPHFGYQLGAKRGATKGTMPREAVLLLRRWMMQARKSGKMGPGSLNQVEHALDRCDQMLGLTVIERLAEVVEPEL